MEMGPDLYKRKPIELNCERQHSALSCKTNFLAIQRVKRCKTTSSTIETHTNCIRC